MAATRPLPEFRVTNGLPVLGPEMVELVRRLDGVVVSWAEAWGAPEYLFPEVIPVADLARIDYLTNFPQLAFCAAPVWLEAVPPAHDGAPVPAGRLEDAPYALQTAACYNLYFALQGQRLLSPVQVTLVGRCFRRESHYDGLERLLVFRQREIVCVGPSEAVVSHLERCRAAFAALAERLGLSLNVAVATDPFFGDDPARAKMQRLFPTKHEFVHEGRLAVASLNSHRNFFGQRCGITLDDGQPAFSGCFGVGLERLCAALMARHGGLEQALQLVRRVAV